MVIDLKDPKIKIAQWPSKRLINRKIPDYIYDNAAMIIVNSSYMNAVIDKYINLNFPFAGIHIEDNNWYVIRSFSEKISGLSSSQHSICCDVIDVYMRERGLTWESE